ncbi:uncharacterized protein EV420DRAFT_1538801 [Desarmillaria tabescens]|uniref:BTB domain-containing protein n=1 Tax=Armillaria tabescens TaxID=1929756 RepID=A0AA39KG05_ARMTA|nr:uncharacterized protein EV420DRAFT_1538801 [Desarmillaria tabescens]KAK0459191.1 hypothetical protein EV420DRAFT_1538801 [Desarmillaria tabescens]
MDDQAHSKAHARNKTFYWELITFLVEDQLFKVTRHMFEESSEVFSTMLSLPQGTTSPVDGSDDEHPLVLQGVKSADFENLLKVMVHTGRESVPKLSHNEWLSALKLATMWGMTSIRRMAISEITQLNNMTDVDQVMLGREYAVVDWVMSGYQALTKRKDVISIPDASRLTLSTCLKVWQAQVSILNATASSGFGSAPVDRGPLDDIFASELDEVYQKGIALGDGIRSHNPRFSPQTPPPTASASFGGFSGTGRGRRS